MKTTKHQEFAEKMDGLFAPEIVKHIDKLREEAREGFEEEEKGKWGNFADRMSGLTTPEVTEHIENTSKELRGK